MNNIYNDKRCSVGVWDDSVPGIVYDENGVSNYALMLKKLIESYPRGSIGEKRWSSILNDVRRKSSGKKYDCIVGISGGTDSCYLSYLLKKKYNLNPLAVNLDNGWNSDIALKNIKRVVSKLNIDLETFVIDYEEIKDLLRCYMIAGLPWIDSPTDLAIKASLYKIALKEHINYIFRGNDFRSEGMQPREWTYSDGKQLLHIHKLFGNTKLKTYPNLTIFNQIKYSFLFRIKSLYPYYYLDYKKSEAKKFLKEYFDWEDYGGHHFENRFTKFAIGYWQYKKFNIDKRIISFSAQIISSDLDRAEAIEKLKEPPYPESEMNIDREFIIKKLDFSIK